MRTKFHQFYKQLCFAVIIILITAIQSLVVSKTWNVGNGSKPLSAYVVVKC
jgi:hypothetical protein